MKKVIIFIILLNFFFILNVKASIKNSIISKFETVNNLSFKFKQNINEKIETGNCIIQYPKKIYCEYNNFNKKLLVSNGKNLVIKNQTSNQYYIYPIEKTALNLILDKDYLLNKITNIEERVIDEKFINYKFFENDHEINVFFDYDTHNLIGWQTIDIYQNLSITFLSSVMKNQKLKNNLFNLPKRN